MTQYELSKSWMTDGEPVRSLGYTHRAFMSGSEGGILSSTSLSQPSTIDTEAVTIQPGGEGTRHSHQITALLGSNQEDFSNSSNRGAEVYVTGCKDHLIRVFDAESHALLTTLRGHENAVTSLSWLPMPPLSNDNGDSNGVGRILISGSWDGTAKLWWMPNGNGTTCQCTCIATLPGHENTVSVAGLPPLQGTSVARLATGSAGVANGSTISDYKIRMWDIDIHKQNESVPAPSASVTLKHTVVQDHHGPIRGLVYDATSQMLLSCSNDGTVKVRDSHTGQAITTLSFHHGGIASQPPMLLSVTSAPSGYVMASGEDGTVIIWNVSNNSSNENHVQIIPHPDCVWKVLALSNGDLITACHDGTMRIFTTDEGRIAPPAELEAFQQSVLAARQKSSTGPSAEEIASLPKWEERATIAHMGQSEGQVKVFARDNKAIAAQWSMASSTWIEVGEVTGRNDHAGTIDGVEYDHVFPIEVDVAGGGVQNLKIGYNNGENPFVTAQKFIDDYQLDQGYLAQIADYIRNRVGEAAGPTLGMGGGSAAGASAVSSGPTPMEVEPQKPSAGNPLSNFHHLPMKGYRKFEAGADAKVLAKMTSKIQSFNTSILNSTNLSPAQIAHLDTLCQTLAATNRYHASTISMEELEVVRSMMMNWSKEHVFPSIDLARLLALHPHAASGDRKEYWNDLIVAALDRCDSIVTNSSGDGAGVEKTAIPMLSLRLFANCFRGGVGTQSAVETHLLRILKCVDSFTASTNKNIRLALATILLNASSYLKSTGSDTDCNNIADLFLITVGNICGSGIYETEAMVRVIVALGTAIMISDVWINKAKALNMGSMLNHIASQHGEKAKAIVGEIHTML